MKLTIINLSLYNHYTVIYSLRLLVSNIRKRGTKIKENVKQDGIGLLVCNHTIERQIAS